MPEMQCNTWGDLAEDWPDPRQRRGRRSEWATLLVLVGAAVASGQQNGAAIAQWVAEHAAEWQRWRPTVGGRVPSAATLRRVLRQVDVQEVERRVSRWVTSHLDRPLAADGREQAGGGPPPLRWGPWPGMARRGGARGPRGRRRLTASAC